MVRGLGHRCGRGIEADMGVVRGVEHRCGRGMDGAVCSSGSLVPITDLSFTVVPRK